MDTKNISVLEMARKGKKLYRDRYLFRQWLKITIAMFRSGQHVLSKQTTKQIRVNPFAPEYKGIDNV